MARKQNVLFYFLVLSMVGGFKSKSLKGGKRANITRNQKKQSFQLEGGSENRFFFILIF